MTPCKELQEALGRMDTPECFATIFQKEVIFFNKNLIL